jgi:hypothetical protein
VRELDQARGALPPNAGAATLTAAASAIHAGVGIQTIRRLGSSVTAGAEAGDLGVALVTLADLVASRVPPEPAAAAIEQLLRRGAPESEMAAFRAAVSSDVAAGLAPEAALRARVSSPPPTRARTRPD